MSVLSRLFIRLAAIVAIVVVAGLIAKFASEVWAWKRHGAAVDELDVAILRLAEHSPPELTDDQWAYCVMWTLNLHSNYSYICRDTPAVRQLTRDVHARIDDGVDITDIDWIWDRYFELIPRAKNYDHFRPTAEANAEGLQRGDHGNNPLSSFQEKYREKLAEVDAAE